MQKDKQIKKAYRFFLDAEKQNRVFSLREVAAASGWTRTTVTAYKSKKWYFFIKDVPGGFKCEGVSNISEDAFIRIHAQRTSVEDEILRPRFTPTIDGLIEKSKDAAMLAIQTFNSPLIRFRAPGYIVNIVIAYTALFHAIFERNGVEYWYKEEDGTPKLIEGDPQYWELKTCVIKYYKGEQTPESENINFLIKLRNKIEHRFIPPLDLSISGYCQASLSNFEKILIKEFGSYFALGQNNLALALQLTEYSSHQHDALRKIQSEHFDEINKYIKEYREGLPDTILISSDFCFRAYLLPIIGNHAKSSDVAIEFVKFDPNNPEEMKQYDNQVAFIKQKQVQVADQGKLKPGDVVKRVSEDTKLNFRMHHHTNAWKMYKVRSSEPDPEKCNIQYCQFSSAFKSYIYTEDWVKFLCEKIRNPDEFERIKNYH